MAKKYKNNKNLLIAEIDATRNEIENITLTTLPALKLWPSKKKNTPIDYNQNITITKMEDFLEKHCTNKFSPIRLTAKTEL